MNDKPTLQDLLEVQQLFGLPSPALVEKDWYVVRALAAIAAADPTPLRLVFGGGTALSRAHRLIRRMSEDVDLKIVADHPSRAQLRALREKITTALLAVGFQFDPENREHRLSQNETRYTLFRLPYTPSAAGEGVLRPRIQIELAVWPLLLPDTPRSVRSFVAEANRRDAEIPAIACVSVAQTAAEKFVALTRRIGAERAQGLVPDRTLLRHIYDLWAVREHYDRDVAAKLIPMLIKSDADTFARQFAAYQANPLAVIHQVIEALTAEPVYAREFDVFLRDMVYGEPVDFHVALRELQQLFALLDKN